MKIGRGPNQFEVSRETVAAALRDLYDVELAGTLTRKEVAGRRLVANVLRREGASWDKLAELLGGCGRWLVNNPPIVGTPLWACWTGGRPDDPEAELAGERLLERLRGEPPGPLTLTARLRQIDGALSDLIDQSKALRRELRVLINKHVSA